MKKKMKKINCQNKRNFEFVFDKGFHISKRCGYHVSVLKEICQNKRDLIDIDHACFFGNCIGFHLCVSKCVPLINNSINHSILFKENQCCSEIAWCLPWVSDGVVQFLDLTDFLGKEGGKEKI